MSESDGPADAQVELGDNALHSTRPATHIVGTLAVLAVPLGLGGFLFVGVDPVAWLPTPLRLVPYSILTGCILMAIYQKYRGTTLKQTIRFSLMTGILAGLLSTVTYYLLLIVVAASGIH